MRYLIMCMLLLSLAASAACSLPGIGTSVPAVSSTPSAAISSPTTDQQLTPGQETQVKSVSVDAEGVVRVELVVDGQVVWVDANAEPQANTPFIVAQPWTPNVSGQHTLQVRAYNKNNQMGESELVSVEVMASPSDQPEPLAEASAEAPAGSPTLVPTATSLPPATPTRPPSTPTPDEPSPTPTTAPTRTPTPPPQSFEPKGLEPEGRFAEIWNELGDGDSRLGYPTGPVIADRDYARQRFQNGLMVWWNSPEDPAYIWVIDSPATDLKSGLTSNLYADTWDDSQPDISCAAAEENGPVRGFGKVWCDHPELLARIGYPTEAERGSGGNPPFAQVQFFQGGAMLYIPHTAEVFVLFAQGDWQRFNY